jgi:hypothetical protein
LSITAAMSAATGSTRAWMCAAICCTGSGGQSAMCTGKFWDTRFVCSRRR